MPPAVTRSELDSRKILERMNARTHQTPNHALLAEHLQNMHELSPPESVHALNLEGLKAPDLTFWTVWSESGLIGCGALKELSGTHGEVKSMRTPVNKRRQGAGRFMLSHIIAEARRRGYERLSLETGAMDAFTPAQRLYESYGFVRCGPFGSYVEDPNSVFMSLELPPTVCNGRDSGTCRAS